jgi:3-oxoacyl-[acyl-carrier-protein] synthase II
MAAPARPDRFDGRGAAVITGLGAVCSYGWGVAALRAGLLDDGTALRRLSVFDAGRHRTALAGEVPPAPGVEGWSLSRCDRFAIAAAREAVRQAGLLPGQLAGAGVFCGSSNGGLLEGESFYRDLCSGTRLSLRRIASHQNNGPGDAVARDLAVGGPVVTCSSACTSSNMALWAALESLRAGEVEVAVAGGADALCEVTYAGFNALRAVDPAPARPFRADRAGLSLGEGAGFLVLESPAHARARGARVIAELAGAGATCDAHHMSAPKEDGRGPADAMRAALLDAGADPDQVAFVNAHGTGTPHNDAVEAKAVRAVFGARAAAIPLTSTKSKIGHLLGACGGVEAVACVLGLTAREVHATAGGGPADETLAIDLVVGKPRNLARAELAISNNLAFGGNNCSLVFARPRVRP